MNRSGSSGLANGECACGIAADRRQKTDDVAARHPEELSERSQLLALRQQICCPWEESLGGNALRSERHRERDRECASQGDPLRVISERRTVPVDVDRANEALLKVHR